MRIRHQKTCSESMKASFDIYIYLYIEQCGRSAFNSDRNPQHNFDNLKMTVVNAIFFNLIILISIAMIFSEMIPFCFC